MTVYGNNFKWACGGESGKIIADGNYLIWACRGESEKKL